MFEIYTYEAIHALNEATDPMVVLNPDGSMEIHQELELVEQSDL